MPGPEEMELLVENRMANDGAEHLLSVGSFGSFEEVARAAYAHMNGRADAVTERDLAGFAERIAEVTGPQNSIFRGVSEDGTPYTFYLEPRAAERQARE